MNDTVPVAKEGDTVAVNVTEEPETEGFEEDESARVAFALFTVSTSTDDVLPLQPESPLYKAVIEWDPAVKLEVLSVLKSATLESLSVLVPRTVVPSMKVTVPVANDGVTVAVNVTTEPYVEGLRDETSLTLVAAILTVSVRGDDVLPL